MPGKGGWTLCAKKVRVRCECRFVCRVQGAGGLVGNLLSGILGSSGTSSGVVVLIKRPLEIPQYQEGMEVNLDPPPATILNEGRPGHEVIAWFLPSSSADASGKVQCCVTYDYTYYQRLVAPLGQYPPGFCDISDDAPPPALAEKCRTTIDGVEAKRFDFKDREFIKWFEKGKLHESSEDESEIDFALRVLDHMGSSLMIGRKNKGLSVRQVMNSMTCTCHGCNSVFVTCMRRKGIPARVKHGQKLKKENTKASSLPGFEGGWTGSRPPDKHNGHSKSDFYASGLGWVPVETVYGKKHAKKTLAKRRLADKCEEEPHLVKYYDMGDGTNVDLRALAAAIGPKTKTSRAKLYVGQLSNVTIVPVSGHTLRPGTYKESDLRVHMHYNIK
eukprot:CAMPEP_0114605650 /NCGR_PEP_ID=MMETSP0168-20121206/1162_1 /TAXON_ID=95228 ORGANISM="Vannella sp., Strain DIVA3 517/6/12" /NCGR_SAMPLE_ID=MMETSP0168 /ASSEMBLY_ACC=CAM_ASM_000044 /LENGTH=386 /DNA_ID=CAMNT_0001816503 /DNA_START=37 /DNA_END=1197 /DNA_ORIENTATION=-